MAAYADCRCLWLPKAGRSDAEYEDAFWPRCAAAHALDRTLRFAVADGATESSFARRWARQLVVAYCRLTGEGADATEFGAQVERKAAGWMRYVYARPLPWNVLAKVQRGAHATLTGLTLIPAGEGGRWEALAVGDSCLFQVRGDALLRAFPQQNADAFGFHPQLLCSVLSANQTVWAEWEGHLASGEWAVGDLFLLMTDALAHWFVGRIEAEDRPWVTLLDAVAGGPEGFTAFVTGLRAEGAMNNDDVTLMLLTIGEDV